jgi:hypothetical protein
MVVIDSLNHLSNHLRTRTTVSSLYLIYHSLSLSAFSIFISVLDLPGVTISQAELRLEELLELQYLRHPVSILRAHDVSPTNTYSLVWTVNYRIFSSKPPPPPSSNKPSLSTGRN